MKVAGKGPDDPNIPRGKPHTSPPGFLKSVMRLPPVDEGIKKRIEACARHEGRPLKTEMSASQKNGLLCFDIGGLQIAMDEEQARAVKAVIDSWLAGDPTGWARGEG